MNGKTLQTARKKLGLTQIKAAEKLGVSQAYFSLFEKGKHPLTNKLAAKAVRLFNLPPTVLPLNKELKDVRPATTKNLLRI